MLDTQVWELEQNFMLISTFVEIYHLLVMIFMFLFEMSQPGALFLFQIWQQSQHY